MHEHDFTLILANEPDEAGADRIYSVVDDGTLATIAGVARIDFHREATSLEDAIRSAINNIQSLGYTVERVEMEPEALAKSA